MIVSIKAKTVKSGGFLGNSTVQIQNQEQYCQQQDKKYKKNISGMSTQTTIQMPLFFFFRNVLLSFLTLLTSYYVPLRS